MCSRRIGLAGAPVFVLAVLLTVTQCLCAQTSDASAEPSIFPLKAQGVVHYDPSSYRVHVLGVNGAGVDRHALWAASHLQDAKTSVAPAVKAAAATGPKSTVEFFPADLSYQGGKVVQQAESNDLYVNCAASCWGNPATFLARLGESNFIHVTDQYVNGTASNRYTVGPAGSLAYPTFAPLGDNDLLQIAHAGAAALGTGYGHIFHIFLPKGVDVCFTGTTECYSPDNPSTFIFCAFHASVDFSDIGHVLFTVEPFQNVPGCAVGKGGPNGVLVDSTSSVLSHELIETITDPDGSAWFVTNDLDLRFAEIGDVCQNSTFVYPVSNLPGRNYEIQPEYSNQAHTCVFTPPN